MGIYRNNNGVIENLTPTAPPAIGIQYDNTSSGLDATNVQDAVDEVNSKLDDIITIPVSNETALQTAFDTVSITAIRVGNLVNVKLEGTLKDNLISNWYNLTNTTDLPKTIEQSFTSLLNNFDMSNNNADVNGIVYMINDADNIDPHRLILRLNKYDSSSYVGRLVLCNLFYRTDE